LGLTLLPKAIGKTYSDFAVLTFKLPKDKKNPEKISSSSQAFFLVLKGEA
jgi:hypothetical protein